MQAHVRYDVPGGFEMNAMKKLVDALPKKVCSELREAIAEERKRADMNRILRALRR